MITGLIDLANTIKEVDDSFKKQIPYATSQALKQTSARAQTDVVKHIEDTFDVSNGWYKEGRRYGVKKTTPNKRNLKVRIYMDRPGSGQEHWIEDHESGEVRHPDNGRDILIPTDYFSNMYPLKSKRSIKRKVGALLKNKKKNRIFEASINSTRYIFQAGILGNVVKRKNQKSARKIRGSRKRKVLNRAVVPILIIKSQAKQKATLDFEKTIRKRFDKSFQKDFDRQLTRALANRKV